jgi:hypothetical protein
VREACDTVRARTRLRHPGCGIPVEVGHEGRVKVDNRIAIWLFSIRRELLPEVPQG